MAKAALLSRNAIVDRVAIEQVIRHGPEVLFVQPQRGRQSPMGQRRPRFSFFGASIMKSGRDLICLATELQRQLASKRDLIVPSPLMRHATDADGISRIVVDVADGPKAYGVTDLARRQLADKLKIPYVYFERMRSDQPALLDSNVNTWLQSETDKRMLRTLDGQVRAVLSDRYRRLDNYELAEHVLPILKGLPDARFESVELTQTRLYLKVVTPRVVYEVAPGDIVQAGVVVSNSEVGQGTLSVQPLVYRLVCRNGLIAADHGMRKTHVGKAVGSSDDAVVLFAEDTLQADDQAFFLKVRDVVRAAVSEASFVQIAQKMQRTLGIRLQSNTAKVVEVLADRYTLNETERSGVLQHLIEGGDLSAYGLVNAVTHYSQDVQDYDRATEFEMLGGKLIELGASQWREMGLASREMALAAE